MLLLRKLNYRVILLGLVSIIISCSKSTETINISSNKEEIHLLSKLHNQAMDYVFTTNTLTADDDLVSSARNSINNWILDDKNKIPAREIAFNEANNIFYLKKKPYKDIGFSSLLNTDSDIIKLTSFSHFILDSLDKILDLSVSAIEIEKKVLPLINEIEIHELNGNIQEVESIMLYAALYTSIESAYYWESNYSNWMTTYSHTIKNKKDNNEIMWFDWRSIPKSDVAGAIGGALGGAVAGTMAAGVGAGPGAAAGFVGGAVAGSVGDAALQILDHYF